MSLSLPSRPYQLTEFDYTVSPDYWKGQLSRSITSGLRSSGKASLPPTGYRTTSSNLPAFFQSQSRRPAHEPNVYNSNESGYVELGPRTNLYSLIVSRVHLPARDIRNPDFMYTGGQLQAKMMCGLTLYFYHTQIKLITLEDWLRYVRRTEVTNYRQIRRNGDFVPACLDCQAHLMANQIPC